MYVYIIETEIEGRYEAAVYHMYKMFDTNPHHSILISKTSEIFILSQTLNNLG